MKIRKQRDLSVKLNYSERIRKNVYLTRQKKTAKKIHVPVINEKSFPFILIINNQGKI